MKLQINCFLIIFFLSISISASETNGDSKDAVSVPSGHPRILLLEGEETGIRDLVDSDETWRKMHLAILKRCDSFIDLPPVERILIGRRLLDKSKECLKRVFYLSYAYRMTGKEQYLKRAEVEMLAVSGFSDWNPTHFLDVAEMTMAVAIGYDWLYENLTERSRKTIREAIVNKGINPSFDSRYNHWLNSTNNWNQVCNAGIAYGALAVWTDYPEMTKNVMERALISIKKPMEEYKPNGAYPEGYGYWGYGTSFNLMFLSAVEKALQTDNGLTNTEGFLNTGEFMLHMVAPSGIPFNWGDCAARPKFNLPLFWFADMNNDPSVLWSEKKQLQRNDFYGFTGNRLLPAIMIWGKNIGFDEIQVPASKNWIGQGTNPVALLRTSWTDPKAIYVGFKGGTMSVTHAHMDVGSFIMEADGVRWAADLGSQNYESLESKGMNIFGRTQDAERWTIFRMNNYSHNVLTVDEELQQVKGHAKIDKSSDEMDFSYAISEISSVYDKQLKKATRGIAIKDQTYVVVRDELETLNKPTKVQWKMLTPASVEVGTKEATLTLNGKKLFLKVLGPDNIEMKTWSTAPTNDYDAENPGTILVGFECELDANTAESFEVLLIPENANGSAFFLNKKLVNW